MSSHTTENTLRLARRVVDYQAYSVFSFYNSALEEQDKDAQELYARIYNSLVNVRQKLTEEGIAQIGAWTGPECSEIIPC